MSSSWAASALEWWEEAGVDLIVGEQPRDWLSPKAGEAPRAPEPAPAALPDTLDSFQAWLASSPDLPLASPSLPRALPSGDPDADLMVMVDMPSDDGALLSGEAGALFDKMLVAIGRSRDSIYLASLSPVRTPTGAIGDKGAARLAQIARHHAGLVGPKVLLLFGDICGKALVGSAVAGARAKWHEIATPTGPIKALVTIKPEKLVETPAWKKFAWADLQMLMEALT
jgi:DNA polymerase